MRCGRLSRRLLLPVLLAALASGCPGGLPVTYRPVTVLARDAETQKAIPGAEVRIFYPLTPPQLAPANSMGTTGVDGVARLRAAPTEEGFAMETTAPGYLLDQKSLAGDVVAIPADEPFQLFGRKEQPPVRSGRRSCTPNPAPRSSWWCRTATAAWSRSRSGRRATTSPARRANQRCFRYDVPPSGNSWRRPAPPCCGACRTSWRATPTAPP